MKLQFLDRCIGEGALLSKMPFDDNDHKWGPWRKGPKGITMRSCVRPGCDRWRTHLGFYSGKWTKK